MSCCETVKCRRFVRVDLEDSTSTKRKAAFVSGTYLRASSLALNGNAANIEIRRTVCESSARKSSVSITAPPLACRHACRAAPSTVRLKKSHVVHKLSGCARSRRWMSSGPPILRVATGGTPGPRCVRSQGHHFIAQVLVSPAAFAIHVCVSD